jgi:hypothetical protein
MASQAVEAPAVENEGDSKQQDNESDRVEGTTVYDPQGNSIGSIKRTTKLGPDERKC